MTGRQSLFAVAAVVLGVALVVSASSLAARKPASVASTKIAPAEQLYRQYCGQCHALAVALSAGFGSAKNNLGANGGPSFNNLRVPYAMSIEAITEPTGGHEALQAKMSMSQLNEVASYLAKVTADHPILATSTDG